ncbi:MAG: translation elongation factor Ts [Patescibacteria group bacterium]|nr:translation elongation factor Ts [Patescibacteria group bacterium]
MSVSATDVQRLRAATGAGIMDAKRSLEEAGGDVDKAKDLLKERGLTKAAKKADRETAEGVVHSYIHGDGKIGVLLELLCETDFVAKNDDFRNLAQEISMQIAAGDPKDVKELLAQPYIKDEKQTVEQLLQAAIAKLGENIKVTRFARYALGVGEGAEKGDG